MNEAWLSASLASPWVTRKFLSKFSRLGISGIPAEILSRCSCQGRRPRRMLAISGDTFFTNIVLWFFQFYSYA